MAKRIICFAVAICLLCGMVPFSAFAADDYQQGYIEIAIANGGTTEYYPAMLDGETIYMSIKDIAYITGYDVMAEDLIAFTKASKTDDVTCVDIEFDGSVKAGGKELKIHIIDQDGTYYLPLAQMLYLLHAQWLVADDTLVVQPLPNSIVDFAEQTIPYQWDKRVNSADLLINGECNLANAIKSSLAAMFTDFDLFDHIDWDLSGPELEYNVEFDEEGNADVSIEVAPEGASPFVGEQYKKALLQLAVDDVEFLQEEDQLEIAKLLEDSGFKQIKSDWDTMNDFMEFPTEIPETADEMNELLNQIAKASGSNPSSCFDAFGDLSGLKDVPWKSYTDFISEYHITDAVDFIEKCVEVSEVYQRSKNWSSAFVGQMKVLTDFDNTGYRTSITDYIKEQSREIVKEYEDPANAAWTVGYDQMLDFVAGLALDATPLGTFLSLPNIAVAGAGIFNENVKTQMDSAALSSMVDCLVKTEHVALIEAGRSYEDMLAINVSPGFDEEDLERLRNATMLTLRCNLRNRAFIYYLNTLSNDDPNWEQSSEAQKIREQIQDGYVSICNLMETEGYDRLLFRTDLNNIFNWDGQSDGTFAEYGDTRQEFGAELFKEGEIPEEVSKLLTQIIEYDSDGNLITEHLFNYNETWLLTSNVTKYYGYDDEELTTYSYDEEGRLLEINAPIGQAGLKNIYNDKGQVVEALTAYSQMHYTYDDQGNLIQEKEIYDFETYISEYAYSGGVLSEKKEYIYPVGAMDENATLNASDAKVTIYTYDYDDENCVTEENWSIDGDSYCNIYDCSYYPIEIVTQFRNDEVVSVFANIRNRDGTIVCIQYLATEGWVQASAGQNKILYKTTPAIEPEYQIDEYGYLKKVISYHQDSKGVVKKHIFEFCYDGAKPNAISPEDQQAGNFSGSLQQFLDQKAYLPYWENSIDWENLVGYDDSPAKYVFLDINQDGNQELIISGENNMAFYPFLVFQYNTETNQVSRVAVEPDVCLYYNAMEYSEKYSALVFSNTRYGTQFGGVLYYQLDGDQLVWTNTISWEPVNGNVCYFVHYEEVSEDEFSQYRDETQAVSFLPLE